QPLPGVGGEHADEREQLVRRGLLGVDDGSSPLLEHVDRMVKAGQRERVLALEVVVYTALVEARGGHDVAHRRAGVAAAIEDLGCALDDELARSIALSHHAPSKTDRSV